MFNSDKPIGTKSSFSGITLMNFTEMSFGISPSKDREGVFPLSLPWKIFCVESYVHINMIFIIAICDQCSANIIIHGRVINIK